MPVQVIQGSGGGGGRVGGGGGGYYHGGGGGGAAALGAGLGQGIANFGEAIQNAVSTGLGYQWNALMTKQAQEWQSGETSLQRKFEKEMAQSRMDWEDKLEGRREQLALMTHLLGQVGTSIENHLTNRVNLALAELSGRKEEAATLRAAERERIGLIAEATMRSFEAREKFNNEISTEKKNAIKTQYDTVSKGFEELDKSLSEEAIATKIKELETEVAGELGSWQGVFRPSRDEMLIKVTEKLQNFLSSKIRTEFNKVDQTPIGYKERMVPDTSAIDPFSGATKTPMKVVKEPVYSSAFMKAQSEADLLLQKVSERTPKSGVLGSDYLETPWIVNKPVSGTEGVVGVLPTERYSLKGIVSSAADRTRNVLGVRNVVFDSAKSLMEEMVKISADSVITPEQSAQINNRVEGLKYIQDMDKFIQRVKNSPTLTEPLSKIGSEMSVEEHRLKGLYSTLLNVSMTGKQLSPEELKVMMKSYQDVSKAPIPTNKATNIYLQGLNSTESPLGNMGIGFEPSKFNLPGSPGVQNISRGLNPPPVAPVVSPPTITASKGPAPAMIGPRINAPASPGVVPPVIPPLVAPSVVQSGLEGY